MDWIVNLFTNTESVAHIALLYAIVIAIGVYLGKIKIGGISLGVTFVLFAGILAGHVGFTGPKEILTFVQDFGLILFVFMIGLQVDLVSSRVSKKVVLRSTCFRLAQFCSTSS